MKGRADLAHKIALVKWVDSAHATGWQDSDVEVLPLSCETVGFIWQDEPDHLTLALSVDEQGHPGHMLSIPKFAIKEMSRLRGRKPEKRL